MEIIYLITQSDELWPNNSDFCVIKQHFTVSQKVAIYLIRIGYSKFCNLNIYCEVTLSKAVFAGIDPPLFIDMRYIFNKFNRAFGKTKSNQHRSIDTDGIPRFYVIHEDRER